MFSILAKPIMISKHVYNVVLTPYLPYVALGAKLLLYYWLRLTQIVFFCFVKHFQLLMLIYHYKFAVNI